MNPSKVPAITIVKRFMKFFYLSAEECDDWVLGATVANHNVRWFVSCSVCGFDHRGSARMVFGQNRAFEVNKNLIDYRLPAVCRFHKAASIRYQSTAKLVIIQYSSYGIRKFFRLICNQKVFS